MAFGGYYQKAEDEQCGPSGKVEPEERKWGGVGTRAGERARCLFPCISSLDRCLLDDGIKESFNSTSVLFFLLLLLDKTHRALALTLGHTVHHTHLVKRGPAPAAVFR